jgi:hypothetical protein
LTLSLLFSLATAQAAVVTYSFGGSVTDNSLGTLFPGLLVGESYTGTFTLDEDATPILVNPGSSSYDPTNFEVTIEGTSYNVTTFTVWSSGPPDGFEFSIDFGGNAFGFLSLRATADIYSSPSVPTSVNISDFDVLARVSALDIDSIEDSGSITSIDADGCTLNLLLSYEDSTLVLDFDLVTTELTTWNGWMSVQESTFPLWSIPLPPLDLSIPISSPGFPQLGSIGVLTTLTTPTNGIICSVWETVDTGTPAVMPSARELMLLWE